MTFHSPFHFVLQVWEHSCLGQGAVWDGGFCLNAGLHSRSAPAPPAWLAALRCAEDQLSAEAGGGRGNCLHTSCFSFVTLET